MRRFAWILLVAGIAGVLWFLAARARETPGRTPSVEPAAEPQTALELPKPTLEVAPSSDRTSALDDRASAEVDPNAGWRVCVVDAATNAPVGGALVSVLDMDAASRDTLARGIGFDTLEGQRLRRERMLEARTGADGCVRFAAPPEHASVEARSGDTWAFALVNQIPADRCVTLKLAPDRELRVRVVDASGTPAGEVPVAVRLTAPGRNSFKWTDTQPGTGVATFLHFQRRLQQGPGWQVLLAFPVRDQVQVPVDESTPLEPPVALVLPDTGRVRVRVRAADGSVPDLEGIDLQLDAFQSAASTSRLWPDGPWARPHVDARAEALVPWIGLGLQFEAALLRDGKEKVAMSRVAGPTQPGEEVLCDLVWTHAAPSLVTGRFVFRDGRAWPAVKASAYAVIFPAPAVSPEPRDVEVESDGRFRMPLRDERPANGTRAIRFSAPHPELRDEVITVVPLDQDVPPEGLHLGDVVLDFGELLVSGHVVDAARRPIAGASSYLHASVKASGKEFWPRVRTAGTVRTAAEGAFALYLIPGEQQPAEELRLETSAKGFASGAKRDVRRGERGVEVVLAQAGALAGSLELDRGLTSTDVVLVLAAGDMRQNLMPEPDGKFQVSELLPWTYSLDVRLRGSNGQFEREPAVRIDNLLVLAGETCRDPRVQGLRLESVLATLRIRVVDRASTPLRNAAVKVVGRSDARAALSKGDGVCVVRYESLPVDLDVSAFGYQQQRLLGVATDREVVLDSGLPIRLHTSAKPSGGDPKYSLGVFLHSVDANGALLGMAWGPEYMAEYTADRIHFDEHGELRLRMPAAGVYECDVQVTVLAGNVGRGGRVELSPRPRITVLASSAEQVFELSIPQAAIDAAVQLALQ